MHFVILCVGTEGDFLPLLPLVQHLLARTHQVTLLGPPPFSAATRQTGARFVPLWTQDEQVGFENDIEKIDGRYGLHHTLKHAIEWNESAYNIIRDLNCPDMTLLAADHTVIWADVAASIQLRCRVIRFQIDPPRLPTIDTMRLLPFGPAQKLLAMKAARALEGSLTSLKIDSEKFSLSVLPEARRAIPRIALWPQWLAPEVRDSRLRTFGFLVPEADFLSTNKVCWVKPSTPFVVFIAGPRGTAEQWSARFFVAALEACRRLGIGAILLRGRPPAPVLPAWAKWYAHVPFNMVLPHASLLVHHGGIGTAAAAIRHGLPQLVTARLFTQSTNGEYMRRLGVAYVISPERFSAEVLYRLMARALDDEAMRRRSQKLSLLIDTHSDAERACDYLEELNGN